MHDNQTGDERVRVLVADNTTIHTQLLANALKQDHGLDVVGFDSDFRSLVATVASHRVQVLLLSSNLGEDPQLAFQVLRTLQGTYPGCRAVILLDSSKREDIVQAFRAGARGIFSRHESIDSLAKCIRTVHDGEIWASNTQMSFAVEALASSPTVRAVDANGLSLLSKREMEVVRSLSEGLTNREIAERLGLSQHTVKNYLFRVFDKLGVSSRMELLFMTMSSSSPTQSLLPSLFLSDKGYGDNEVTLAICQRAAEEGIPLAQFTLAKTLAARKSSPQDLVQAYMWYLIVSEQISRAKNNMNRAMTMEELLEAEQSAAEWMRKTSRIPSSSVENSRDGRKKMADSDESLA